MLDETLARVRRGERDPARSHNHAFRGTVDDWLYQYVAGIQPTKPAYRKIRIKPYPPAELTNASAHVATPLGEVRSSWLRSGKSFKLSVHIPVGATAKVRVPAGAGAHVSAQAGASRAGVGGGYVAYKVGSGDYTSKVSPRRR